MSYSVQKIGIYGGTFSPPHNGHILAAKTFFDMLSLDKLLVIPANIPPHKELISNCPTDRFNMTKLAFSELNGYGDKIIVDDFEISRNEKSYTANTLTHFANDSSQLYFLCGTDMFLTMSKWYRPDIICDKATIVLMRRETNSALDKQIEMANNDLIKRFNAKTLFLNVPPIEISSSEIRSKIARGEDVSEFVSGAVLDYIKEKRLYCGE